MRFEKLTLCLVIFAMLLSLSCDKRKWTNPLDPNNELPTLPGLQFNPQAGNYTDAQNVTITCPASDVEIRYTINGSMPNATSNLYTAPITINSSVTINALAFKDGYNSSTICSAGYTINDMVAMPSFDPPAGIYNSAQVVSIFCNTPGALIRYTLDGTNPTTTSTQYTAQLTLTADTELKARAFKTGWNPSAINSALYNINQSVPTPTFYPLPGAYAAAQNVTISCPLSGVQIRYTTDGTVPTEASGLYSAPVIISGATTTLKAKAFKTGWNASETASGVYTVTQSVANPGFNPAGGTYSAGQSVTLSCATAGATIRYTTSGTDPTATSTVYNTPIYVSTTTTLKARAFKTDMNPSSVSTAYYTITPVCSTPDISPASGTYTSAQSVTMTCATSGATIRYTLNGLEPSTGSTQYTGPISISTSTTVKAKAFKTNYTNSNTATRTYSFTMSNLSTPTASPQGGIFTVPQIVSISCDVSGAEIHYTTNGLDPTISSPLFTENIQVKANTILKAKAFKNGYNPSNIMTANYFFRTYLQAWGRNSEGQNEIPATADIIALAAGYYHAVAIRDNKSLVAWGYNGNGETDVPAGNDYIRVAAGYYHSLALRENGTIVAWGRNNEGQCNAPTSSGFVAISAGNNYCLALRSDGQLFAWGSNTSGCLTIPSGTFTAISAGFNHCLAIKADGSLQAWGRNTEFQCDVPAGNNFVDIAAGYQHSLALRNNGSLSAWGDNFTNQCEVPPGYTYISVGAGYGHSTAIKVDGTLVAWGRNDYQQCDVPAGMNYHYVASGFFNNIAQRSLGKHK